MSSDTNGKDSAIDRRRFLELAGVSGAAALAGCGGDGGGATATATETPTDEPDRGSPEPADTATPTEGTNVIDRAHKNSGQAVPPDTHFNGARDQNYDWNTANYIFERYAAWNFQKNAFEMAAISEWEIGKEAVTLSIREDLTWDNGNDVTSQDVVTQMQILKKIGSTIWDYTDSVEAVDDKTVQLNLSSQVNPTILKYSIAARRMGFPDSVYSEYVDKEASAVQSFEWTDPIASGAFSFETKNSQEFRFSRNPEYYNAENVNYSTQRVVYRDGNTAIQQGLASGELEGSTSLFVPAETVKTFPDTVVELTPPAKWGYGMLINHDDPIFGRRSVRQAMAHVIDRQAMVDNAGPRTKFPAPKPCGIAPKDQERWLGDDMSKFKGYGVDSSQTEKAAQILRDDGFQKKNGTWQRNGTKVKAEYLSPAGWTDFTTMTETLVDQLSSFGFDLTVNTLPTSDWGNRYRNSNFKIGARQWLPGGPRSAFPYFPLRHQILNTGINGGHNFPEGDRTVPAMSGDGTMTVNPRNLIKKIARTQDEAETKRLVKRAAWHNNHDLPMLSLICKFEQSWLVDDKEWDVVDEGDPRRQVKWPPHWLPRTGGMTATSQ